MALKCNIFTARWTNGLRDTDKSLQMFFEKCSASSPDECAFWSSTPEEISQRLDAIYESLRKKPLAVTTNTGYGYDILDYSILRGVVFTSLYEPYALFRPLALGLKELEQGNGTLIISMAHRSDGKIECESPGSEGSVPNPDLADASTAIYCSDTKEINDGPQELYEKLLSMFKEFSSFAQMWIRGSAKCAYVPFSSPF